MVEALLDTDILSAVMRQQPMALAHARIYLAEYEYFTFSIITRYEVLRRLKARGAVTQLTTFDRFCLTNHILRLTDEIIIRASDIYADLHRRGELIGDADILIAATALEHGLVLVTNNEYHFRRIPDLLVENWLKAN